MNLKIKVSVIIPVYAVEKYLTNCVESVLKQSYPYKEIILVDDGSPDSSGKICDQYASNFADVKVIHKENGGLSDARNNGIENATGDYVLFLDGDDFWDDENALRKLVGRLETTKVDVLNFSFKKYYEDTKEEKPYFQRTSFMPVEFKTKKQQLQYLLQEQLYLSSACTKIVRRELLKEELLFEKDVYSEDVEWSAKLITYARNMDFICENFYCYRQRKDSISHTINDKKCEDLCKHIINCIKLANIASEEEKPLLLNYAAYQYGTYFIVQAQALNEQRECIEKLSQYKNVLENHAKNKKLVVLYLVTKILGYKKTCKLIRYIYKLKR